MAIVTENYVINGRQFVRTYSDAGRYVVGGDPYGEYAEANDPAELGRTYTEGGIIEYDYTDESDEAKALTRFANSITGASNHDLISATETLIEQKIKEE